MKIRATSVLSFLLLAILSFIALISLIIDEADKNKTTLFIFCLTNILIITLTTIFCKTNYKKAFSSVTRENNIQNRVDTHEMVPEIYKFYEENLKTLENEQTTQQVDSLPQLSNRPQINSPEIIKLTEEMYEKHINLLLKGKFIHSGEYEEDELNNKEPISLYYIKHIAEPFYKLNSTLEKRAYIKTLAKAITKKNIEHGGLDPFLTSRFIEKHFNWVGTNNLYYFAKETKFTHYFAHDSKLKEWSATKFQKNEKTLKEGDFVQATEKHPYKSTKPPYKSTKPIRGFIESISKDDYTATIATIGKNKKYRQFNIEELIPISKERQTKYLVSLLSKNKEFKNEVINNQNKTTLKDIIPPNPNPNPTPTPIITYDELIFALQNTNMYKVYLIKNKSNSIYLGTFSKEEIIQEDKTQIKNFRKSLSRF